MVVSLSRYSTRNGSSSARCTEVKLSARQAFGSSERELPSAEAADRELQLSQQDSHDQAQTLFNARHERDNGNMTIGRLA